MRRIPSTMATQHPDNAAAPYWQENKDPFIRADQELADLLISFQQFGTDEYMWDWEGKYADASVIEKLYASANTYFKENPIGRDKFVTFRIPNIWQEKGYSLMQVMSVVLAAEDFARDLKHPKRPLFEIILPMTESSDQILHMHRLFKKLATFKNEVFTFDHEDNTTDLELIPLVESVDSQQAIGKLLDSYTKAYKKEFKKDVKSIRPFIACSDPALMSGWLATLLANKDALSQMHDFGQKNGISVNPISGAGSLPFRGGLSPQTVGQFMKTYSGLRTVTIQSSFRFDHPINQVQTAVEELNSKLPKTKPVILPEEKLKVMRKVAKTAQAIYQKTLREILPDMQPFFASVPKRRERKLHIGLIAYSRKVDKLTIPRAITFTSGFYSLGVPPEFIGLGRTLVQLSEKEKHVLLDVFPELPELIARAGNFINRENIARLTRKNKAWSKITEDIKLTEAFFDTNYSPRTINQKSHLNATSNVLLMKNNPESLQRYITESALLRKSLG